MNNTVIAAAAGLTHPRPQRCRVPSLSSDYGILLFLQGDCACHPRILYPSCSSVDKGALPSLSKQKPEAAGGREEGPLQPGCPSLPVSALPHPLSSPSPPLNPVLSQGGFTVASTNLTSLPVPRTMRTGNCADKGLDSLTGQTLPNPTKQKL